MTGIKKQNTRYRTRQTVITTIRTYYTWYTTSNKWNTQHQDHQTIMVATKTRSTWYLAPKTIMMCMWTWNTIKAPTRNWRTCKLARKTILVGIRTWEVTWYLVHQTIMTMKGVAHLVSDNYRIIQAARKSTYIIK